MEEKSIALVFPGDNVSVTSRLPIDNTEDGDVEMKQPQQPPIRVGSGLIQRGEGLLVAQCGILRKNPRTNKVWIESPMKRYIPTVDDHVIGVITGNIGEYFKVDIGASREALLDNIGFEGATKRSRPVLPNGSVVLARVILANKDMNPEITCKAATSDTNAKEWVTGESIYGELKDGHIINCSISLARKLLDDDCAVLNQLGRQLAFEVAIGYNGRVWVKASSRMNTILICNCILNSEKLSDQQTTMLVNKVVSEYATKD
jgi:exosome complex component RRP40